MSNRNVTLTCCVGLRSSHASDATHARYYHARLVLRGGLGLLLVVLSFEGIKITEGQLGNFYWHFPISEPWEYFSVRNIL